ncbi:hypothetical protein HYE82_33855 [Streptomyces sp. BR123]|uniref:hypothetical protein n=1 Tax=Streptomyces sp. BR123 TaxID=2749828 RepID=UPI0015C4D014|nr:hypothetical protein [Streptomyces sp. BR123]NXY99278.1 hypothetical protein [Streptomyces sp. BR123]
MPAKPSNRPLLSLAAATLAVAATTAVAPLPAAHAANGSPLSAAVSPTTAAPGNRVALILRGCGSNLARAGSSAFGEVRLSGGSGGSLTGSATILRNASTGVHPVTFECGDFAGSRVTISLQVAPGAARGGAGGSIGAVSPAQIAIGGTLAASALGTGIWILRRRARTS